MLAPVRRPPHWHRILGGEGVGGYSRGERREYRKWSFVIFKPSADWMRSLTV